MFLRNVITWLEKKIICVKLLWFNFVLGLHIIFHCVKLIILLRPYQKTPEYFLLCVSKIMFKRYLQFLGGRLSKVPREIEKMFRRKFGVIFYQRLLRRLD